MSAHWHRLLAIALSAFAVEPAFAGTGRPSLAGVWDGTIGAQPVRVCFNEKDWGTVGAYYYRSHLQAISLQEPDDNSGGFVEEAVDAKGNLARWTFDKIDANAIAGRWTQGARKLPLRLSRVPGLRLKDDETPCGSMLFQGPRLDGVRVVSKPATKDGLAYTRLILDHRGHFGDDVDIGTFALGGDGPAVRRINASVRKPLAGNPPDWVDCERMAWNNGSGGASNFESYELRMVTKRWLGVIHHWDGFCGGAHPDSFNSPILYDRQTGAEVDIYVWLNAKAVKRQKVGDSVLNSLVPAFRNFLLKAWKPDDADCADAVRSEKYWNAELTRSGFVFSPQLPHVVQACEEDFPVSFARLQPWLSDEGKKQVMALQAEVAGKR
jgi:hypothetical protein